MTIFDKGLGINRVKREEKIIDERDNKEKSFIKDRDFFMAAMEDQSPTIQQNREMSDLTRWQQDLGDDIQDIIHDLRREIKVDGEWVRQKIFSGFNSEEEEIWHLLPPMMNELGIRSVISLLKPLTSRNLMMSNYDEDKILRKLRRVLYTTIIHLGYHQQNYHISKKDLSAIVQMFRDVAEPAHWRAMNNGERKFLTSHTKRIETHSEGNPFGTHNKKLGGGLFK